jgi:hypothetical protein
VTLRAIAQARMNISSGFSEIAQPCTCRNTIRSEIFSAAFVIFSRANMQLTPVDQRELRSILVTAGTVYESCACATTMAVEESGSISLSSASAPSMM